jgi:SH3 domain protein
MIKYLFIFMFLSILSFRVSAEEAVEGEILYITDQLRLSLYETAAKKSKVLQYLVSGEKLEVTQSSGAYAFVTTESGKKGWVKRGFLVSKLPTITLLKQELEKTKTLAEELNKLSNSSRIIAQYEKDMDVLSEKLKAKNEANKTFQNELDELKKQAMEKQKTVDLLNSASQSQHEIKPVEVLVSVFLGYWRYILPFCLGFILIGFIIARKLLEARMKKKFQGVKVW